MFVKTHVDGMNGPQHQVGVAHKDRHLCQNQLYFVALDENKQRNKNKS